MSQSTNEPSGQPDVDRNDLPEVIVPMIVCPECGSEDRSTRTSRLRADGVRVSQCQCRECGQRFRVQFEPPQNTGNSNC